MKEKVTFRGKRGFFEHLFTPIILIEKVFINFIDNKLLFRKVSKMLY